MTKVLFLIEKDGEDVFAYFPETIGNGQPGMFTSYAHIGQHSACHEDYAAECKEAELHQYQDLLKELIEQGYNDLLIMNSQKFEYGRNPTAAEIKFGNGAAHYRSFTAAEIRLSRRFKGSLNSRFKADDGLIYTR